MNNGEAAWNPGADQFVGNHGSIGFESDVGMERSGGWFCAEFVLNIPENGASVGGSSKVGGRFVDDRDFETFGVGLLLSCYINMNSVLFAIFV